MSKLDELGGHKYTAGFLVAHSDERVKAAGRDILALIERIEELRRVHIEDIGQIGRQHRRLQRYRELAEMVDEFLTRYPFSGKLAINIKTMTRELLKEGV